MMEGCAGWGRLRSQNSARNSFDMPFWQPTYSIGYLAPGSSFSLPSRVWRSKGSVAYIAEGAKTGWRAGAIMLQHLPEHGEHLDHKQRKDISFKEDSTDMEEDWRRANILLDTCTAEEFLAPALDGNELLVRLFHEEGVRVYTPTHVIKKCRCSRERIEGILKTLSEEELQESAEKSKIEICCEFCNEQYLFKLDDILGARDA